MFITYPRLDLTDRQREALSLGLNFKVSPKRIDRIQIGAQFERFFEQFENLIPTNDNNSSWSETEPVDVAEGFIRAPMKQNSVLKAEHFRALKDLQNQVVYILKPDEGTGVVIMDKVDYLKKMEGILQDEAKFKRYNGNETAA